MSKTIVQKYGGSSVADVDKIRAVAALIKARQDQGTRVCVVVSAMGKTTDQLLHMAGQMAKHPPRRELDMLLTTGERASAALLAMALHDIGVDAISFTGSQAGIITNATHAGARVLEVRPYRVQDELDKGTVVVIAGFQGVSYAKEITTLGRGGSDTTAVALAAALDADCEIYSDVDGVWTSDPRVVPEATRIEALTHEEMQELAAAGAKDCFSVEQGPFYAMGPVSCFVKGTDAGLAVNGKLEILDGEGHPVQGLYGAGLLAQGGMLLEGHGHHIGWAFTSGRLAGRAAAYLANTADADAKKER